MAHALRPVAVGYGHDGRFLTDKSLNGINPFDLGDQVDHGAVRMVIVATVIYPLSASQVPASEAWLTGIRLSARNPNCTPCPVRT